MYVAVILLDDWVEDPTAPDENLVWSYPRDTALRLAVTPDCHLVVRAPNADWQGTETVTFTVCNPAGECVSGTVSFRVENAPDDPVIEWVPDRVAGAGKPFADVDLRYFGWDPDGDDLTWNVRGGAKVTAADADGVLRVEAPGGWIGRDPITLELTDSTGRGTSRAVDCVVANGILVAIASLGVEGILIECGATRILIDVGGTRSLHLRDATDSLPVATLVAAFGWPTLGIDVPLASGRWVTGGAEESPAAEAVAPRFAIPTHFPGVCPLSRTWYDVGGATPVLLYAKGASWVIPPRDGS